MMAASWLIQNYEQPVCPLDVQKYNDEGFDYFSSPFSINYMLDTKFRNMVQQYFLMKLKIILKSLQCIQQMPCDGHRQLSNSDELQIVMFR